MKTLPFWILLLLTFGQAALEKILDGGVPSWFTTQFQNTFMATLPGLTISYYSILGLELSTALLILVGLARREFLLLCTPKFLTAGFLLAQITFITLGFGLRLTQKYNDAAQLFAYTVLTFIAGTLALKSRHDEQA